MITWCNERRKVSDLIPAKYNPRKLSDKDKADLTASINKFSLADPIIINQNNVVIGGHQRIKILKERGVVEVDVRMPDRLLNESEEEELNLRLNKNLGAWDESLLSQFEPSMLADVGFDGDYIDSIFKIDPVEDDFDSDAEYEKINEASTVRGDIYILGDHRLMCGDSQSFSDVEKLMGDARADLIYTDPPYNVDYTSPTGAGYSKGKFKSKKIFNDNQTDENFVAWLTDVMRNAFAVSHDHANLYCWFAMSNYSLFRSAVEAAGFKYMQVLTWVKERFIISFGWYFHRATEPCMIFYKDWNKKYVNYKYAKEDDLWDLDKIAFSERLDIWYQHRDQAKDYEHPTQKPVRLAERAIKKNSEPGHVVLDLFGGSGSTLLCCEQLSRKCYAMEMDPKYCDVIVKRWEKFTGKKAEKV